MMKRRVKNEPALFIAGAGFSEMARAAIECVNLEFLRILIFKNPEYLRILNF